VQVLCGLLQPASVAGQALQPELGALRQMLGRAGSATANVQPRGDEAAQDSAWSGGRP